MRRLPYLAGVQKPALFSVFARWIGFRQRQAGGSSMHQLAQHLAGQGRAGAASQLQPGPCAIRPPLYQMLPCTCPTASTFAQPLWALLLGRCDLCSHGPTPQLTHTFCLSSFRISSTSNSPPSCGARSSAQQPCTVAAVKRALQHHTSKKNATRGRSRRTSTPCCLQTNCTSAA